MWQGWRFHPWVVCVGVGVGVCVCSGVFRCGKHAHSYNCAKDASVSAALVQCPMLVSQPLSSVQALMFPVLGTLVFSCCASC